MKKRLSTIFYGCLMACCLSACTPIQFPAVSEQATDVYLPGKFVWFDLLTGDKVRAKKFYGALLGWTFREKGAYTVILNRNKPIACLVQVNADKAGQSGKARWLPSLSVNDVDAAAALTVSYGGLIHEGPKQMHGRGRYAFISDPTGAQLLLLKAVQGDPVDTGVAVGDWLWNELWTSKATSSQDFYKKLANYSMEVFKENYVIFSKDEQWRAGLREIRQKQLGSRWVPTIRVVEPMLIAQQVVELGGQVLLKADPANPNRKIALLQDPDGALFMVQAWKEPDNNQ